MTLGCLLLAPVACGSDVGGEPLGQEGAHEHGVADVSIVVDGREATVSFRAPAGDLYSYGGDDSAEGRDLARAALRQVESRLVTMLGVPEELECRVADVAWSGLAEEIMGHGEDDADGQGASEVERQAGSGHDHDHGHDEGGDHDHGQDEGADHAHDHDEGEGHADVIGDFRITCGSPLAGTTLRLAFTSQFEAIEKIDLQVISEERQLGRRVPAAETRVEL